MRGEGRQINREGKKKEKQNQRWSGNKVEKATE